MSMPNIIERLEQLDYICTELRVIADSECENCTQIEQEISNIEDIVGEILTMIDGR